MKLESKNKKYRMEKEAAAFGRLCVETRYPCPGNAALKAAAFGRLCVETSLRAQMPQLSIAAAFGRLCVETNVLS